MTGSQQTEELFYLRRSVARIGEADWMRWWDSNALNLAGEHLLPRIFRRTAAVTGIQVAVDAARVRQDAVLPREPRIHLFDLGRQNEIDFARWIGDRKQDGWDPAPLPASSERSEEVAVALAAMGVEPTDDPPRANVRDFILLGEVEAAGLREEKHALDLARQLASAYAASSRGALVVPYFRLT